MELNPYDKNALVARSKCHLLMGNASSALKDAEQALTEDKTFIKGNRVSNCFDNRSHIPTVSYLFRNYFVMDKSFKLEEGSFPGV